MDLHLRGKRALVTGASYGIGATTAEALAEEGCAVHLAARSKSTLDDLAERLRERYGVEVNVHAVDLRHSADLAGLAEATPELDILVNNAGDIPGGRLDSIDEETWRHAWELKVFGYLNLTRLIYARMKERGHGVIINNIGASGERFDFDYIAGSSGNSALMAFTRALGSRSLHEGIRVVGVNPGPVETERIVKLMKTRALSQFGDESRYLDFMSSLPLGRPAKTREIADLITFLASDRSAYTTGVIYTVDGGISAA